LCNNCRSGDKSDIPTKDGLLGCNYCPQRVKTLFTSDGRVGGDMCANCYASKCKKCGASIKGSGGHC